MGPGLQETVGAAEQITPHSPDFSASCARTTDGRSQRQIWTRRNHRRKAGGWRRNLEKEDSRQRQEGKCGCQGKHGDGERGTGKKEEPRQGLGKQPRGWWGRDQVEAVPRQTGRSGLLACFWQVLPVTGTQSSATTFQGAEDHQERETGAQLWGQWAHFQAMQRRHMLKVQTWTVCGRAWTCSEESSADIFENEKSKELRDHSWAKTMVRLRAHDLGSKHLGFDVLDSTTSRLCDLGQLPSPL